jgi:hypothetical protein
MWDKGKGKRYGGSHYACVCWCGAMGRENDMEVAIMHVFAFVVAGDRRGKDDWKYIDPVFAEAFCQKGKIPGQWLRHLLLKEIPEFPS